MIIVLHHGMFAWTPLCPTPLGVHYWHDIDDALIAAGHDVIVSRVHPSAGVRCRAAQLKRVLLGALAARNQPDAKVLVIGHSMGGMDARYMVSRLGMAKNVAAILTVGTGHRGSAYYDWAVDVFDALGQLRAMSSVVDLTAIWDSTTAGAERLDAESPDQHGVGYFSVAGSCPPDRTPLWLLPGWQILHDRQGDNDGRVAVVSARHGTDLGTWPAHHFHLINAPAPTLPGDRTDSVTWRYLDAVQHIEATLGRAA